MYFDGVIAFSLLMIALILVMMGYIGVYFYRHIKKDTLAADLEHDQTNDQTHEKQCENCDQCECKEEQIFQGAETLKHVA